MDVNFTTFNMQDTYQIGIRGFEELIHLEPKFEKFFSLLFSESLKAADRSQQQTIDSNNQLNAVLSNFCRLLSPYFLLLPSHKCLHWLMYAFKVHLYNIDLLMECGLPYYETGMFTEMLQYLQCKDDRNWKWLHAVTKSGFPPSRLCLTQRCLKSSWFLSFICEMVCQSLRTRKGFECTSHGCSRTMLSFYCSTIIGMLEAQQTVDKNILSCITQYLLRGLKSSVCDFKAATLMIVGVLGVKVVIRKDLLYSLLRLLVKVFKTSLAEEALMCTIVLCTNLQYDASLPEDITSQADIFQLLVENAHRCSTFQTFIVHFLKCSIGYLIEGCELVEQDLVIGMLDRIKLSHTSATKVIRYCVKSSINKKTVATTIEGYLQTKYPVAFNEVHYLMGGDRRNNMTKLEHSAHVVEYDQKDQDLCTVNQLVSIFSAGTLEPSSDDMPDAHIVLSMVLRAITSGEPDVVLEVLQIMPQVMLCISGDSKDAVFQNVLNIISRKKLTRGSTSWQLCVEKAVSLLCSDAFIKTFLRKSNTLICALLPLMFISYHGTANSRNILNTILSSPLPERHGLLKNLSTLAQFDACNDEEEPLDGRQLSEMNQALMNCLTKGFVSMRLTDFINYIDAVKCSLVESPIDVHDHITHVLIVGILVMAIKDTSYQCHMETIDFLVGYLEHHIKSGFTVNTVSVSLEEILSLLVQKHTRSALKPCHTKFLAWIIDSLIVSVSPPADLSKNLWLETPVVTTPSSPETKYYVYLLSLFKLLLMCIDGKMVLQKFIKFHLSGKGTLLRFLAMIWNSPTSPDSLITETLQVDALGIAAVYMQSRDVTAAVALTASSCPVIPSLLLPLGNSKRLLRKGSLNCLKVLHKALPCSQDQKPLFHFLEALIQSVHELEADNMGISLFLEKYFCPPNSLIVSTSGKKIKKSETVKIRETVLASISGCFSSIFCSDYEQPPYHIMRQFLQVFCQVEHEKKLLMMLSPLRVVINRVKEKTSHGREADDLLFDCLRLLVSCYTVTAASHLTKESEAFETLVDLLSIDRIPHLPVSPAVLAIRQITPEFFQSLNSIDCQKCLFKCLLDMLLASKKSSITALIKSCLQQLPYSSEIIIGELSGLDVCILANTQAEVVATATPSRKRSRKLKDSRPPLTYKRIAAILEILRSANHMISDSLLFVPVLFQILSVCLNAERSVECSSTSLATSVEYLQQLVMDILLELYKLVLEKKSNGPVSEDVFNVEILIQTLHVSSNIQLQHSILLLLSTVVSLFPLCKIHNIMPVFTFIGQSLSKQDNQLTLEVIEKTISTILLALIKNTPSLSRHHYDKKVPRQLDHVISDVLRMLVDSLPHVPHHRCLPLLSHFLNVVGPADYLHVMLGLLTEKCVVQSSEQKTPTDAGADIRFLVCVTESFNADEQISAVTNLLRYLIDLPQDKPSASYKVRQIPQSQTYLFNIRHHSHKQFRQFRYAILSLLPSILDNVKLDTRTEFEDNFHCIVASIFRQTLEYLGVVIRYQKSASNSLSTRYWEAITKKVNSLCEKVVGLIPLESFLNILHTSNLLITSDDDVRLRAMNTLNRVIEQSTTKLTKAQESGLLCIIDPLETNVSSTFTSVIEKQTALYGLKLIISRVGRKSKPFSTVAKSLMDLLQDKPIDPYVQANALLCLAELCCVTPVYMIQLVPSIMPLVLSNIDEVQKGQEFLYLSSLSTLSVIVKHIPTTASFLPEILLQLSKIKAEDCKSDDIATKVEDISCAIADSFPPRVLISVLKKTLGHFPYHAKDSLCTVIGIFKAAVSRLNKEDMETSLNSVTDVFLFLLNYRSTCNQKSGDDIGYIEESVNSVFCEFAMKLSEISFRPLFMKVLQWASEGDILSNRMISFCHLTKHLSMKFKSLFLLFADQLVNPFVKMLDSCNLQKMKGINDSPSASGKGEASVALEFVLDTLCTCFLYDRHSFVTKETFNAFLEPLINQVGNTTTSDYQERIENHLAPCISQFAVAAGKDILWKTLTHELLMQTRHSDSQVRFASLLIIKQVYFKLGEECTVLLPESIPFLSELMEDECVEVEKQAQATVSTLEEMTGESVQQYL